MDSQQPAPRTRAKIIALVAVVFLVVFGATLTVTVGGLWLYSRHVDSRFDRLEKMMRTAYPELASLDPIKIELPTNAPMLGSPDAKVTIVEYADYQCPFCKQFHDEIFPQLKQKYIDTGKVKFYYQDFAFLGEESQFAAEAAKCAGEQNKYWDYHNALFAGQGAENSGTFNLDNLKKMGSGLSLDQGRFAACVDSRINKPFVEQETQAASSYGVAATPTIFINGVKVQGVGQFSLFEQRIDDALKQ